MELDEALANIVSGTTLYLLPGTHTIHNSTILKDMSNISIIGQPEDCEDGEITITCLEGRGLLFSQISGLVLKDITISECGAMGEALNETINMVYDRVQFVVFISPFIRIAVFMGLCENVEMENVTVTNTTGIGLVGVNIFGQSWMHGVDFTYNRHSSCDSLMDNEITGGGAYFFYGNPTSSNSTRMHMNTTSDTMSPSLTISESRFAFNSDCSRVTREEANYRYILASDGGAFYRIGGGGGLSLFLAQKFYSVFVPIISTNFFMNSARYGSGAHVGMFAGIARSTVYFYDCKFETNIGVLTHYDTTGGGGLAVFTGLTNPLHAHVSLPSNEVVVYVVESLFVGNSATKGGGLFTFSLFDGLPSLTDTPEADTFDVVFILHNCIFIHNAGPYGAALSFQQRTSYGYDGKVAALISNVSVSENTHAGQQRLFGSMDSSAVHLESVYVVVYETLDISDNDMTGMYILSSSVHVVSNATLSFSRNTGILGGGVHLAGRTPLIAASPHSSLSFSQNRATIQGGAVYVTPETMSADDILLPFKSDCFFLPLSIENACAGNGECNSLNISVLFEGNSAPLGSVVFGSTLESCYWVDYIREARNEIAPNLTILEFISDKQSPLFEVDQALNSSSAISTVPSSISINTSLVLIPGQKVQLTFTVTDDYGNIVPAVVSSLVSSCSDNSSNVSSKLGESGYWFVDSSTRSLATFQLTGVEDSTVNVTFFTTTHLTTKEVSFKLSTCPLGVVYDGTTSSCVCDPRLSTRDVSCDNSTFEVTIPDNVWMGTIMGENASSEEDVIVARCNARTCGEGNKRFDQNNFDSQCSPDLRRSGLLCGGCAPNTSAILGNNSCQKCSHYYILLIPLFGLAGILLFVTIALLGFTIDKGWINIVLFYCNFLSFRGYAIALPRYGMHILFIPSSLISLQLGVGVCFYDGMTPLAKTGLRLIFPVYLYLLMVIFTLLCRRYYWLSKRFSPTTTFVTLLIMCYVSTLTTCITILAKKTVYTLDGRSSVRWLTDPNQEYFRGYHTVLVLIAAVLMVTYVIPFPFLMLCPKLLYRYVKKLVPFYDALWAPFKTKYRSWLGLRLITRLLLFSLPELIYHSLIITTLALFILLYLQLVFKPFKSSMVNYVDNFLIGTITIIMIGALHFDAGGFQVYSEVIAIIEKILLVVTVGAGYVTVAAIFYYLLRDRLVKLKSMFLSYVMRSSKKCKRDTAVTHSEVGLSHEQSMVHSTDVILDLEQSRQSVAELESVVAPPVILQERVRFNKFRESLLET